MARNVLRRRRALHVRSRALPTRAAIQALVLLQALALSGEGWAQSGHAHPRSVVLAPGYADLEFVPPAAGSYELPPLGIAADGPVLDTRAQPLMLHDLLGEKITILSFIYTSCSDVNGCPLATYVLKRVSDAIIEARDLRGEVRLISMSFDPAYDTPAVMDEYADRFRAQGTDWHFLTSSSEAELAPILRAYDQWVVRDYDSQGEYLGTMSHLLRVFLIDRQMRIRDIYSVSFLHAQSIANDIRTLLSEEEKEGG